MPGSEPIQSLDEPIDAPGDPAWRRLLATGGVAGLGLLGLAGQLWRLQVLNGAAYRREADENRFRLQRVEPPRGVIDDRNGRPLARNRPFYTVAVVPADLPRPPDAVFRRLARLLGTTADELRAALANGGGDPFTPVPVRAGIDPELAFGLEERGHELPGVHVVVRAVRDYPDGALANPVVGFVGRVDAEEYARLRPDRGRGYAPDDQVGKTGVELVYEPELRGRPGERRSEVDPAGRKLTLTLDMALQREVTRVLAGGMPGFETASAVALDPRDGQVLALVHLPTFDNNLFARGIAEPELAALLQDPRRPLVNGAIAEAHPPGSVFKIVTGLGALLLPNRLSPAGATRFPCWAVHGWQDCATALANSCNVYFYQAGGGEPRGEWDGLGVDRLPAWARRCGLGAPTGIDLPTEESGLVPDRAWKRQALGEEWFKGDTFHTSIGQGFLTATPLQVASLVAAVANGGRLYRPRVLRAATDERGGVTRAFRAEQVRDLGLDPDLLLVVQRGLRYGLQIGRTENGTSYTGTAWDAELRGLAVAGKTGTAEWGAPDPGGRLPTHGWFVGYAPYDDPQLALAVFVRRGQGGHDAARLARRIFAYYFGVPED